MLKFKDVSLKFNNFCLSHINFTINEKDLAIISGDKKSGKTLITKLIFGQNKPTEGEIEIFDLLASDYLDEQSVIYSSIGYMPEMIYLDEKLTVLENLILVNKDPIIAYDKALCLLDIDDLKYKQVQKLDGLDKRKVYLAGQILNSPKLLILDEPSGSLDFQRAKIIYEYLVRLNELGITILVTSKYDYFKNYFKVKFVLEAGKLI